MFDSGRQLPVQLFFISRGSEKVGNRAFVICRYLKTNLFKISQWNSMLEALSSSCLRGKGILFFSENLRGFFLQKKTKNIFLF
jgi:hypothetical protein